MFALMAFLRVWTGATRHLIDSYGVYVPGSASNVHCLLWDVFGPASGTGNNKHPLRQGTLFDCDEGLREDLSFVPVPSPSCESLIKLWDTR